MRLHTEQGLLDRMLGLHERCEDKVEALLPSFVRSGMGMEWGESDA
jgi:hypothetical protein